MSCGVLTFSCPFRSAGFGVVVVTHLAVFPSLLGSLLLIDRVVISFMSLLANLLMFFFSRVEDLYSRRIFSLFTMSTKKSTKKSAQQEGGDKKVKESKKKAKIVDEAATESLPKKSNKGEGKEEVVDEVTARRRAREKRKRDQKKLLVKQAKAANVVPTELKKELTEKIKAKVEKKKAKKELRAESAKKAKKEKKEKSGDDGEEEEGKAKGGKTAGVEGVKDSSVKAGEDKAVHGKRWILFVGNLPYRMTVEHVKLLFKKCCSARMPTEKDNNKPKGYCFVEFDNYEDMKAALLMHHTDIKG